MTLKSIDTHHFYLDDKLIDLVWIEYQAKKQTNAANYYEINRTLGWLKKLAERLLQGDVDPRDEALIQVRLVSLGLGWYLED